MSEANSEEVTQHDIEELIDRIQRNGRVGTIKRYFSEKKAQMVDIMKRKNGTVE